MCINCRNMKYRQFGTEPTYYTMNTCSKDNTHIYKFIYKAFCINMVYFTPMIPKLCLPKCGQLDGGIKLLDHLTCFRNGRFWWEDSKILQNAMAFMANMSNIKRNSRNFPI